MLNKYVNLEQMRFLDKFTYSVQVDGAIDIEQTYIPNMIIQPHVENAIWHGLRYKESKGNLIISIKKRDDKIEIKIEDNGIGITESKAMKTTHQRQYESRGVSNTAERISILNEIKSTEEFSNNSNTIKFPKHHKQNQDNSLPLTSNTI